VEHPLGGRGVVEPGGLLLQLGELLRDGLEADAGDADRSRTSSRITWPGVTKAWLSVAASTSKSASMLPSDEASPQDEPGARIRRTVECPELEMLLTIAAPRRR
jgi:hypothetical protein